jgi:hypothetical protein
MSYDMFLCLDGRQLFRLAFAWSGRKWDSVTTGGKAVVFWRREFVYICTYNCNNYLRKGTAKPSGTSR